MGRLRDAQSDEWLLYDAQFIGHQARHTKIGPNYQVTSRILTDVVRTWDLETLETDLKKATERWNPERIS